MHKWYYPATYIALSNFELFTDYENYIFKVNSTFNLKCEDPNLAEIFKKYWGNLWKVDMVVDYGIKKNFVQKISYCVQINTN